MRKLISDIIEHYKFKILALLVLLLFISGIVFCEVQFLQEKQEPSIYEINGKLIMIKDIEGFQNGTVILNLVNNGPVPVNLTEVFIKEPDAKYSEKLEVITSIKQEISVNKQVMIPIIVTFSIENLDFTRAYEVGYSWTTKTGQGSSAETEFYFSSLENNE